MKITLVMSVSADGKTTKWGGSKIHDWTSKEDQEHFFSLVEKGPVVIMGRRTFNAARKMVNLYPNTLSVVITRDPEKYRGLAARGEVEFTSDTPTVLVKKLEERGFKEALLIGGENTNTKFLKDHLINEVWLTVEPYIFGTGNKLVSEEDLDVNLVLKNVEKLNKKGTLLLKYDVSDYKV